MSVIGGGNAPFVTPETVRFWESVEREEVLMPTCVQCSAFFFPPSPICPRCTSRKIAWERICGEAILYSFMIAENPWPEWGSEGPMSIAHVELVEGPRLISTIVGVEQSPQALFIGMELEIAFRRFGNRKMMCFKPQKMQVTR